MKIFGHVQSIRSFAPIAIALLCFGCASGGAIDYLHKEYGSAESDGFVDIAAEGQPEQIYRIWLHKSKPKIIVQTSLSTAANYGLVKGATFGGVSDAPVQPVFERAAMRWFEDHAQQNCQLSDPVKIHDLVWEFDYRCGVPPVQASRPPISSSTKRAK